MSSRKFSIALIGPHETHDVTVEVAASLKALGHSVELPPELEGNIIDGDHTQVGYALAERLERNEVVIVIKSPELSRSPWVNSEQAVAAKAGRAILAIDVRTWTPMHPRQRTEYLERELGKLSDPRVPLTRIAERAATNPAIRSEIERLAREADAYDDNATSALDYFEAHAKDRERKAIEEIRMKARECWCNPDYDALQEIWIAVRNWQPLIVQPSSEISDQELVKTIGEHAQRNAYLEGRYRRSSKRATATSGIIELGLFANERERRRLEELRTIHGDEETMRLIDKLFDRVHPSRYDDYYHWRRNNWDYTSYKWCSLDLDMVIPHGLAPHSF